MGQGCHLICPVTVGFNSSDLPRDGPFPHDDKQQRSAFQAKQMTWLSVAKPEIAVIKGLRFFC
jgi:hypothetical protein